MVDMVNSNTDCDAKLIELGNDDILNEAISNSKILTNATSVGMAPNTDNCIVRIFQFLMKTLLFQM